MSKLFEGKKILWVEDDIFLGGLIGQRLGELGATLFGANDGNNAIALAKKEKPDLILLDILLPGMNGFDVLKNIKSDPDTKNAKVIIISNLSQKIDIDKGKELGASAYLVKASVSLDEIVDEVKKFV